MQRTRLRKRQGTSKTTADVHTNQQLLAAVQDMGVKSWSTDCIQANQYICGNNTWSNGKRRDRLKLCTEARHRQALTNDTADDWLLPTPSNHLKAHG